ncbi:MAG: lactate dehydrogenase/2-hydroxyacid dehydrogenase, partial [Verrucomicrobiota bacterium]
MNIVVLDGHTTNPGDLRWTELESLGPCEIHDRTAPDQLLARAANAEVLLTNKVVLNRDTLAALPKLRYIGVLATGYNVVDTVAARERAIPVTNVPGYSTRSVAQLTFALLLELTHHAGHHGATVRAGQWTRSPDFCYWDHPLLELDGLTLGVIGFGQIGREVTQIARAFGLRVLVHTRTQPEQLPAGVECVPLDDLLARADIVSLHCPLTPETKQLINPERLARMKPSAFLLNTSRGPLVDEPALAAALNSGRLAGAALDVLSVEPPPATNPLLTAKNCLITPHLGWATRAARERLLQTACANLRAFLAGKP